MDITCSICLDEINIITDMEITECFHIFHNDCLKTWCKTNNSCPLCRTIIPKTYTSILYIEEPIHTYRYSFGLSPEINQPSGIANFSRMDNMRVTIGRNGDLVARNYIQVTLPSIT